MRPANPHARVERAFRHVAPWIERLLFTDCDQAELLLEYIAVTSGLTASVLAAMLLVRGSRRAASTMSTMHELFEAHMREQLEPKLREQLEPKVREQLLERLEPQIREELKQRLHAQIRERLEQELRAQVEAQVREPLEQRVRDRDRRHVLVATLVRQLTAKFGEPSEAQLERIERADDAELDTFLVRVLTADSADAVLGIA